VLIRDLETTRTTTGSTRAIYTRDAMGRIEQVAEVGCGYTRSVEYNTKSQVVQEITKVMPLPSGSTTTTTTTYDYKAAVTDGSGNVTYTGAYMGGAVTHTRR
jgi:hypothetical protein